MIQVVPLKASHVKYLAESGALTYLTDYVRDENLALLEKERHAFTALDEEGLPVACAGVIFSWPGRAEAWAFFDPFRSRRHFLQIHRLVLSFLETADITRIEATVDINFAEGHRWIKLLGFQMEAPVLRRYTVDGRDVSLYSRLKG